MDNYDLIKKCLPVPILVNDVRDLDYLPNLETQLVLQLCSETLLDLGELLHGPPHLGLLRLGDAVVVRGRHPANVKRKHSLVLGAPGASRGLDHNHAPPPPLPRSILLVTRFCYHQVS